MYLIRGTYHLCERRKYAFNVLLEYSIITRVMWVCVESHIECLLSGSWPLGIIIDNKELQLQLNNESFWWYKRTCG